MRKIKFRAWEKIDKEMYQWEDLQCEELWDILHGNKRYILMQYTGLKDKNGKEIYEGDIVKWLDDGSDYPNIITRIHPVIIKNLNNISPMFFDKTEYEIIGNIWENGEILK